MEKTKPPTQKLHARYRVEFITLAVAGLISIVITIGITDRFGYARWALFDRKPMTKIQDRRTTETLLRVHDYKEGLQAHAADFRVSEPQSESPDRAFLANAWGWLRDSKTQYQLEYAFLRYVYLDGADLREINLNHSDLGHASLIGVNLGGASLKNTNFFGAGFDGATLRQCDFSEANLAGAYMAGANLESANLQEANLRSANLNAVDLSNANCRFANFADVLFNEATNFAGADLRHTVGLSAELREHAAESGAILE